MKHKPEFVEIAMHILCAGEGGCNNLVGTRLRIDKKELELCIDPIELIKHKASMCYKAIEEGDCPPNILENDIAISNPSHEEISDAEKN